MALMKEDTLYGTVPFKFVGTPQGRHLILIEVYSPIVIF